MKRKFLLGAVTALLAVFTFSACGKKDDPAPGGGGSYKLKFVATASAGSNISHVTYLLGTKPTSLTGQQFGTSWTKELTVSEADVIAVPGASQKVVQFGAGGSGTSAAANLKVEIYLNDKLATSGSGTGAVFSAQATHMW